METQTTYRTIQSHFAVDGLPVVRLSLCKIPREPRGILVLYGAAKDEIDHRHIVAKLLGTKLAEQGLTIFIPEFRSNLPQNSYNGFGLYDRLTDGETVLKALRTEHWRYSSLSILGVSMGAHIAVELAANPLYGIHDVFIVVPGAYTKEAIEPGVKFGKGFTDIIHQGRSWENAKIFQTAGAIASALVIKCGRDSDELREIAQCYYRSFGAQCSKPRKELVILANFGHNGNFTDEKKVALIVSSIMSFLNGEC